MPKSRSVKSRSVKSRSVKSRSVKSRSVKSRSVKSRSVKSSRAGVRSRSSRAKSSRAVRKMRKSRSKFRKVGGGKKSDKSGKSGKSGKSDKSDKSGKKATQSATGEGIVTARVITNTATGRPRALGILAFGNKSPTSIDPYKLINGEGRNTKPFKYKQAEPPKLGKIKPPELAKRIGNSGLLVPKSTFEEYMRESSMPEKYIGNTNTTENIYINNGNGPQPGMTRIRIDSRGRVTENRNLKSKNVRTVNEILAEANPRANARAKAREKAQANTRANTRANAQANTRAKAQATPQKVSTDYI